MQNVSYRLRNEAVVAPNAVLTHSNTLKQTILEILEASRMNCIGWGEFATFKQKSQEYERRVHEHNVRNNRKVQLTGYKCSIDNSVLEQFFCLEL